MPASSSRAAMISKGSVEKVKSEKPDQPTRTCQFSKTKMCKFELIGMCAKGAMCQFAHTGVELRNLPDLACTKLCPTLIQTGSCDRKGCNYAHAKEELRTTSTFHKTKMCRFSQQGHCALGAKCNFAHDPSELRPVDPVVAGSLESKQLPTLLNGVPKASEMSPQFLPMPSALGCVEPMALPAAAPAPPALEKIPEKGTKQQGAKQRGAQRKGKAAKPAKTAGGRQMAELGGLDGYSAYMAQLASFGWNGLPGNPADMGATPFPDLGSMFYDGGASGGLEAQLALLGAWDPAGRNDGVDDVWQVKNTFLTLDEQEAKPMRSVRTFDGALCSLGGDSESEF